MIRVTFLGTAASRPTVRRNVSSIAVQREGDVFLFDCGEGTQRQMMRYATGFSLGEIFITHLHADHFLGITGLLRTMALQGRTEPLHIYGPPGSRPTLQNAVELGVDRVSFPLTIQELEVGARASHEEYDVVALRVNHGTQALGYALVEHERLGRFDVERARALGIPEGPLFGKLHSGEAVEVDGQMIEAAEVVGTPRPGRVVVYTGDTRPADTVIEMATGAALLIHEATFGDEEADRAHQTYHSTARGAAAVALKAGVARLCLTHVSARYADDPAPLEQEAREVYPEAVVARDGLVVEIPYSDDAEGEEEAGVDPRDAEDSLANEGVATGEGMG